MDVATLGFQVDSSQLARANVELGKTPPAASRAEAAVDKLGASTGRARDQFGRFVGGTTQATTATGKMARQIEIDVKRIEQVATVAGRALLGFFGVQAGASVVMQIVAMADAYTNLNSKLRNVTSSEAQLIGVRQQLYGISQDTRQQMGATVDLYANLTRASDQLGLSERERLRITETVNKAMALGGQSAAAQEGALRQLSQALASGVLRGDEFNSIAEQAPIIMRLVADSLGVTTGELREMAAEGKVTAGILSGALLEGGIEVDRQFSNMDVTIGGAMTRLGNAVMMLVGQMMDSGGLKNAVVENIEVLTDLVEVLGFVDQSATRVRGSFATMLSNTFNVDGQGAIDKIFELDDQLKRLIDPAAAMKHAIGQAADEVGRLNKAAANQSPMLDAAEGAVRRLLAAGKGLASQVTTAAAETDKYTDKLDEERAMLGLTAAEKIIYKATQVAATKTTQTERDAIMASATALADMTQALEDASVAERLVTEGRREAAKADREREKSLQDLAERERAYTDLMADSAKQEREWLDARRQAKSEYEQSLQDLRDEAAVLGLVGDARESAIILLQAERMARQQTAVGVGQATAEYQKLLRALNDAQKAEDAARRYESIWEGAAQSMAEYLTGGAEDGVDGVMRIMDDLASQLQSYWAKQTIVIPLQQQMQGGGGGMAGLGQSLNTNSMYGAGGTGGTAGGWMSAAGSAYGGWEAAQEGNALGTVAGFTAAGAQIGGVYGAIIGAIVGVLVAVFKKVKPPDLRIGAAGYTRKPERSFDTAFGSMQVGVRGGVDENPFIDAVTQFDESIASVIRTFRDGDAQFEEVRQRLSTWSLDLRGTNNISGEAVLEARFGAILETFDDDIQTYVRGVDELDAQVQRLSDAAFIQAAAIQGDLLPGFTDLAAILEANRAEGEAITAVYERLRTASVVLTAALNYSETSIGLTGAAFIQFAADAAEAAGGVDRFASLVDAYFNTFYTAAERNSRNLDIARVNASGEFSDIGLDLGAFTGDGGAAAFRSRFESVMGALSAEALVEWYEAAQALGIVLDLQRQVNEANSSAAEVLTFDIEAARAYAGVVGNMHRQLFDATEASDYARAIAEIDSAYRGNVDALHAAAGAAGIASAREEDLALAMQVATVQRVRAMRQLESEARSLAQQLYSPLDALEREIAALQSQDNAAASIQRFGDAMGEAAQAASAAANLLLGDLSPLKDAQKLQVALAALERGEVSAEDVLRIGRRMYASGADYNALFAQVQGMAGRTTSGPSPFAGGATASVSREMQALLDQRDALQAEQERGQRFTQANQLAQMIADLAGARGESFESVAESLGFTFDQLAADLRLADSTAVTELLGVLQAESQSFAELYTRATFGEQMIVDAIYAAWGSQHHGGDPLLNPPPAPPPLDPPIEKEPSGAKAAQAAEAQAEDMAEIRELLGQVVERLGRLDAMVALQGLTAKAGQQTADELRGMSNAGLVMSTRAAGAESRTAAKPVIRTAAKS